MKIEIVRSQKPKHRQALFLATRNDKNKLLFIGKVYGHEGQDAEGIAKYIVNACGAHKRHLEVMKIVIADMKALKDHASTPEMVAGVLTLTIATLECQLEQAGQL